MYINEKQIRIGAMIMGVVSVVIFSVTPFLGGVRRGRVAAPVDIGLLCSVNTSEVDWQYIVLHHSGTKEGDAASFDAYHKNSKRWKHGLAYHFVIGNGSRSDDGKIEVGRRWTEQIHGAHTGITAINKVAVGICLVGNFESSDSRPTGRQLDALVALTCYLCKRYDIPLNRVTTHRDVYKKHTVCPGSNFPYDEFDARLARGLQNGQGET